MEIFKRILTGLVIFLGILGVVLCLVGIIAVWQINAAVTDSLTGLLNQADQALVFTQGQVANVDSTLEAVQGQVTSIDQTIRDAGDQLAANSPTMRVISNTIGVELAPKIRTSAEVIGTIRGTIISANSTLEAANSIPFVSVPTLPMEQLAAVDQQMQDIVATVDALAQTVHEFEIGIIEQTVGAITDQTAEVNRLIGQVRTPIGNFNTALLNVEDGVRTAEEKIPTLIDWGSVLLTLIFLWFGLAQAGLVYLGWYSWRTGTIPAMVSPARPEEVED
jgi:prefoldin subunit 5